MTLQDCLNKLQHYSISGVRCQNHVARLSQFHRIPGSAGYDEALKYISDECGKMGITEHRVHHFAMDGRTAYGDWVAPLAWEARCAELWVENRTTKI
jgi:hypothetical protein